ncbi:MAG: hypothetical protein HKN04_12870 [Rhodothermaceae bacterium]|nr:hypothetical protein [Rhodothermaceae bacterium]
MKVPSLAKTNLKRTLDARRYQKAMVRYRRALQALGYPIHLERRPVVLVFEGWDAAGKGGAIRHVTAPLDPRAYIVHPIGPPEGEDARRHYLYRFWRRLPEAGRLAVFDRSWYGRVLVERVEGFASEDEWRRAYGEIRAFEEQLVAYGTLIFKFWLHLSPEEQLRRFKARERTPSKRWKLTDEDWRNRKQWDAYHDAVEEMLAETHSARAPWTVVAGDDKRYARVQVLRTLAKGLRAGLGVPPPEPVDRPGRPEA